MNVLLLGSTGYLGSRFARRFHCLPAPRVDVSDSRAVGECLDHWRPDVVINCAAKTGRPNIDWCESHKLDTMLTNVTGAAVVAHHCRRRRCYLVHVSSGCIYQGTRYHSEEDPPNYDGSYYSRTKLVAEGFLKDQPHVLIVRPRMVFDGTPSDRNLLLKIRRYSQLLDEPNSMTYVPDFLNAVDALIAMRATGIYNLVNTGESSPYRIRLRMAEILGEPVTFQKLDLADLPNHAVAGRSNCLLSNAKLLRDVPHLAMHSLEEALTAAIHSMDPKVWQNDI